VLGDKSLTVRYLDPVTVLPSAIGIDSKAPAAEQTEAKKFIAFVLSPQGQKVMQSGDPTGDSLYYPVLQCVAPLAALPRTSRSAAAAMTTPSTYLARAVSPAFSPPPARAGGTGRAAVRPRRLPRVRPAGARAGGSRRPGRPARAGGGRAGRPRPGHRGRRRTKGYLTVTHRSPFIPFSAA
jgi:hypothetical protein